MQGAVLVENKYYDRTFGPESRTNNRLVKNIQCKSVEAWLGPGWGLELPTNLREDFTIMEKAPSPG